ncbi:MAG: 3-dehydroquinate synthase family protein, partial [Planctomycetota bacterium]
GGKVAVNHPRSKNLIGVFKQPAGVLIDPVTLRTLPENELRSGMAEAVKTGVILDDRFFGWMEEKAGSLFFLEEEATLHLIRRCVEIKAAVVAQDEREESGDRSLLNLGHTLGHALETVMGQGSIRHGDGVSVGMVFAARLAERHAGFPEAESRRLEALLTRLGLPTGIPPGADPEALLACMREDKKNFGDRLRFVLPVRIGEAVVTDELDEDVIRATLGALGR